MEAIDFSKAPEGATHYVPESEYSNLMWLKDVTDRSYLYEIDHNRVGWRESDKFNGIVHRDMIEIPRVVYCDNERQMMLCEQVIRMDRGEASQQLNIANKWVDVTWVRIDTTKKYRAKPKKELVVPWEWLDSDVAAITVNSRGVVLAIDGSNQGFEIKLKLDLTDIELPVTVRRP